MFSKDGGHLPSPPKLRYHVDSDDGKALVPFWLQLFKKQEMLQMTTYDFRISSLSLSLSLSWLVGYEYQNFVLPTLSYSLCGNMIFMLESSL